MTGCGPRLKTWTLVLGVDGDARRLDERPPLGQPPPALDRTVVHRYDRLAPAPILPQHDDRAYRALRQTPGRPAPAYGPWPLRGRRAAAPPLPRGDRAEPARPRAHPGRRRASSDCSPGCRRGPHDRRLAGLRGGGTAPRDLAEVPPVRPARHRRAEGPPRRRGG